MEYESFDLMAEYPIVNNQTRYFPLRQAQNDTQYTLGRAFLQDAYVIADYDRSNFSVSQAVFPNGSNTQQIVAIRRPNDSLPLPTHQKPLSTDDLVGVILAAVVSSSIITATIVTYIVRKRTKKHASKTISGGKGIDKAELKGTENAHCLEMPVAEPKELIEGETQRPELPAQPRFPVYEMPEPPTELEDASLEHAH